MDDYQKIQIESKIRELKEKQQKLFNEMGNSAFSYPTYINLQSQIDTLQSQKMGMMINGISSSRTTDAPHKGMRSQMESTMSLGVAQQNAKKRFHKMGKVKQTLAVVSGQMRQLNALQKKVKKGKLSWEAAEAKANGMFR